MLLTQKIRISTDKTTLGHRNVNQDGGFPPCTAGLLRRSYHTAQRRQYLSLGCKTLGDGPPTQPIIHYQFDIFGVPEINLHWPAVTEEWTLQARLSRLFNKGYYAIDTSHHHPLSRGEEPVRLPWVKQHSGIVRETETQADWDDGRTKVQR